MKKDRAVVLLATCASAKKVKLWAKVTMQVHGHKLAWLPKCHPGLHWAIEFEPAWALGKRDT